MAWVPLRTSGIPFTVQLPDPMVEGGIGSWAWDGNNIVASGVGYTGGDSAIKVRFTDPFNGSTRFDRYRVRVTILSFSMANPNSGPPSLNYGWRDQVLFGSDGLVGSGDVSISVNESYEDQIVMIGLDPAWPSGGPGVTSWEPSGPFQFEIGYAESGVQLGFRIGQYTDFGSNIASPANVTFLVEVDEGTPTEDYPCSFSAMSAGRDGLIIHSSMLCSGVTDLQSVLPGASSVSADRAYTMDTLPSCGYSVVNNSSADTAVSTTDFEFQDLGGGTYQWVASTFDEGNLQVGSGIRIVVDGNDYYGIIEDYVPPEPPVDECFWTDLLAVDEDCDPE